MQVIHCAAPIAFAYAVQPAYLSQLEELQLQHHEQSMFCKACMQHAGNHLVTKLACSARGSRV